MKATTWARRRLSARTERRAAAAREALAAAKFRRDEILTSPSATTRDGRLTDAALDAAVARRLELKELDQRLPTLAAAANRFQVSPGAVRANAFGWNALGVVEWAATRVALVFAVAWAFQHPTALGGACARIKPLLAWLLKVAA